MNKRTEKAIRNKIYRTVNALFVELTDKYPEDLNIFEFEVMLLEEIAHGLKLAETDLPIEPTR